MASHHRQPTGSDLDRYRYCSKATDTPLTYATHVRTFPMLLFYPFSITNVYNSSECVFANTNFSQISPPFSDDVRLFSAFVAFR
jgi:hypothetical protein